MKTILLPFHDEDGADVGFETAFLVARRFGGHVEAILTLEGPHLFTRNATGRPVAIQPGMVSQLAHEWRAVADRAHRRFMAMAERHGLAPSAVTVRNDGPSLGWQELEGRESGVVGEIGRLFDLIVIPRTLRDWQAVCEAALFDSGRPVLIAPPETPRSLGEVVVIAWNQSTETARSVALGMPFLQQAGQVIVLSVEGWQFPGPKGEDLVAHLSRNGVRATTRTARPEGRSNGQTILDEARALGADLLVKGAYTQTRLRQMIFGGATRHIITEARLPVLMAH